MTGPSAWGSWLVVLGLLAQAAIMSSWRDVAAAGVGVVMLLAFAPVRWNLWLLRMRPFAYFSLVTLIFGGLGEGRTLVAIGPLHWGAESVQAAGVATARLLLAGAAFTWISLRLGIARLVAGVWSLGRRLKRMGINADPLLLAFAVAVQFLPLLQDEAARLRLAWTARGGAGGGAKVQGAISLFVPLLAAALRRAENFATAIEVRTGGDPLASRDPSGSASLPSVDDPSRDDFAAGSLVPEGLMRCLACVLAAWSILIVRVWSTL